MAFVRWRGGCAQLLASVWEDGRSRQVLLATVPGYAAPGALREAIAARFPTLTVDWAAVDRALAAGPPDRPALSPPARTWAETAHDLRTWALTTDVPRERTDLELAAHVLTRWATRRPAVSPSPPR
ncbi:MAG: hypothetical protein M0Z54_10490 [Thermaerobacter sp.]|nr:hypothetical protein [Thermaerobacter sp.]